MITPILYRKMEFAPTAAEATQDSAYSFPRTVELWRDEVGDVAAKLHPESSGVHLAAHGKDAAEALDLLNRIYEEYLESEKEEPATAPGNDRQKLFDAMHAFTKLVLLYHSGSPWDQRKQDEWIQLQMVILKLSYAHHPYRRYPTGDVTSKELCDLARIILG